MDPKLIEDLKTKHGSELHLVEAGGVEIVIRPADRIAWKRFRAMNADPARAIEAPEQLVRDCCVHPPAEELRSILERKPGLAETFSASCAEISGLTNKVASRKL